MAVVKPKNRKRSILVTVLVFAVIFYFAATLISLRVKVSERKKYNEELSEKYEQQVEDNSQLEKIIEEGDEADYIERIAREEGYAKQNEIVYFDTVS